MCGRYICNETHYRALRAVEAGRAADAARPRAAYFIHVPYANPKRESGLDELGEAVAALILRLVAVEGGG